MICVYICICNVYSTHLHVIYIHDLCGTVLQYVFYAMPYRATPPRLTARARPRTVGMVGGGAAVLCVSSSAEGTLGSVLLSRQKLSCQDVTN